MAFSPGWDRSDPWTLRFGDPDLERSYQHADQAEGVRRAARRVVAMMTRRFPIHLGRRSRFVLLLFGVQPSNAYVDLGEDELDAHFGFFRFRTPTSNLASWRIEGPWRWITAIGVRLSVRQHDLTFGGTNRGGVRVNFKEAVPTSGIRVPALYMTVDDLEGFAAYLAALRLPGGDARKPARTAQAPSKSSF